jgi:hypothetical protein
MEFFGRIPLVDKTLEKAFSPVERERRHANFMA